MKLLKLIRDEILWISLFPEIIYHLCIKKEMTDDCLSNYFKWVIDTISGDGYFNPEEK